MLFHDAETDGKSETGAFAFGLRAEERLEHTLRERFGNSGTVVRDADGEAIRLTPGDDLNPSTSLGTGARDRLGGVVDDVHEYLLDLVRVDLDFRQARLELERQLGASREQLIPEQLMRGLENRPDRLQLAFAFLAAREREQVAYDRRGALRFLTNHRQRLGQPRWHVGRLAQEVGKADDGGERIVQVVRDARDELTDRRHLFRVQQLLL